MSVLSFLRKFGETEDPLFKDLPVETPPPDEGQSNKIAGSIVFGEKTVFGDEQDA